MKEETFKKALHFFELQNYEKASEYFLNSITDHDEDEKLSLIYTLLGISAYFNHKLDDALKYYEKSLNYTEKINKPTKSLGENLKLIKRSIEDLDDKIEKSINENVPEELLPVHYVELGTLYFYRGKKDLAEEYYLNALSIFEAQKNQLAVAAVCNNLGSIQEDQKALYYFYKSYDILGKLKHTKGIIETLENLGNYYYRTDATDSAFYFFKKEIEKIEEEYGNKLNEVFEKYINIYQITADLANITHNEQYALYLTEKISKHER